VQVGLAIFNEVFPLHDLHETVPKNMFYQQMLMFSEGEVPGTELNQGLIDFQALVNKVSEEYSVNNQGTISEHSGNIQFYTRA
jgi:hypothetical protein